MWYERRPFNEAIVENPSQMRGGGVDKSGERRRASCRRPLLLLLPRVLRARPLLSIFTIIDSRAVMMWWRRQTPREVVVVGDGRNAENNHLRLAFGREGGGGGGRRSKHRKEPPPARV